MISIELEKHFTSKSNTQSCILLWMDNARQSGCCNKWPPLILRMYICIYAWMVGYMQSNVEGIVRVAQSCRRRRGRRRFLLFYVVWRCVPTFFRVSLKRPTPKPLSRFDAIQTLFLK